MRLDLAYGRATQSLEIADSRLLGVLQPPRSSPFHDAPAALEQARHDCAAFCGPARRILVLVNDYTRPTPNALVLTALRPVLRDKDVRYLVCSGTHRAPTESEYRTIFGQSLFEANRDRIVCHDCHDQSRLFFVGKTSFGTDVWLNRELMHADRVITINSIEPHYFAGFTGGRKAFLPGIAGHDTITANHNMVTSAGSRIFGLEGNPVHEDMTEAAQMVALPVFSIQLVQDQSHRLLAVRHGDLLDSFESACRDAASVYSVRVPRKAEVVLSVLLPPYDINFYQSQRAVEFSLPALASSGVQITVSACTDGKGHDGFVRILAACRRAEEALAPPGKDAPMGWHKAARLARIMQTAELYTVMGIDDSAIRSVFMTPFRTAQQALDAALAKLGPNARVYVIPDAGAVVPIV
jgi:nickel-dependent lactate racemase